MKITGVANPRIFIIKKKGVSEKNDFFCKILGLSLITDMLMKDTEIRK